MEGFLEKEKKINNNNKITTNNENEVRITAYFTQSSSDQ